MSELDYRLVLDAFADAVVAADSAGNIVYLNAAAERLLGWTSSELLGCPLTTLIPERLRATHQSGFARFQSTREPRLIGRAAARVVARR